MIGIRNILRYAPLYYPDYRIEINNGSQFIFSITYMDVAENVRDKAKMSETDHQNVRDNDISEEELALEIGESPSVKEKKKRRKQGIVGLIASNPNITVDMLSEKMGVNEKTIRRDLAELREQGIIEREGGDFGGHWVIFSDLSAICNPLYPTKAAKIATRMMAPMKIYRSL